MVKNLPANSGDIRDEGSILDLGRLPGEEHGNPLQYFFFFGKKKMEVYWDFFFLNRSKGKEGKN